MRSFLSYKLMSNISLVMTLGRANSDFSIISRLIEITFVSVIRLCLGEMISSYISRICILHSDPERRWDSSLSLSSVFL